MESLSYNNYGRKCRYALWPSFSFKNEGHDPDLVFQRLAGMDDDEVCFVLDQHAELDFFYC